MPEAAPVPLFSPLQVREVRFRNRIFVSPMCQYSCVDGMPTDWHLVHLGSRAVGGAALVMAEATSVSPEGRISPADTGLWTDAQAHAFARIARFVRAQGAVPAIQLAHAGRKASTAVPWAGGGKVDPADGGWETVAPSAIPFARHFPHPRALTVGDLDRIEEDFAAATQRALDAGFEVIELHFAHGYLMHEFLSPLTNHRSDRYGGPLANRMRFPLRIARTVRATWPEERPLFVRISATDWVDGGWDIDQSVEFARALRHHGADLIDCSSGGLVRHQQPPVAPAYQVPFAERIRREADVLTGAVGLITEPRQADGIIRQQRADAVFLARAMLRDPYWPLHAAHALGVPLTWPNQYLRAVPQAPAPAGP